MKLENLTDGGNVVFLDRFRDRYAARNGIGNGIICTDAYSLPVGRADISNLPIRKSAASTQISSEIPSARNGVDSTEKIGTYGLGDFIELVNNPLYRIVVEKYRLGFSEEVERACRNLKLGLRNTAKEKNGRGYISCITPAQALLLNESLFSFTLNPREFFAFLNVVKSGDAKDGYGKQVDREELNEIYREITEVKSPSRGEHLDARFSDVKGALHIFQHIINEEGKIAYVSEPLDRDTLGEKRKISLEQLLKDATLQGLPKKNISKGDLHYFPPFEDSFAGFNADSVRAYLSCIRDAAYSYAELGVRRAILIPKLPIRER